MKISFAVGGGLRIDKCWVEIDIQKSEHFWLIFCSLIYSSPTPDTRKRSTKIDSGDGGGCLPSTSW